MKTLLLFVVFSSFSLLLLSCSSEATPATDDSKLVIEPDTLILTQIDSSKVTDLSLTCGCGFTMEVTNATGDTNKIKYMPIGPLDETLSKHSLRFTYSPATVAPGPRSVKLDFLAKKKTFTYVNSVVVEIR
jgi:hypothetical protein